MPRAATGSTLLEAPSSTSSHPPVESTRGRRWLPVTGVVVAVVAGVVFRFLTRSDIWLDEALTINISRLPLDELPEALRRDGHPPLYYFLLHFWIQGIGGDDIVVRALSGVFGVATLPLAWCAGRRYGGRVAATGALVLLAANPFAVRYSTEARMYSLVMLLVLGGWLAVQRAIERPSTGRLVVVALISGLLLLSHYWAFFLLPPVVVVLGWVAWRAKTPDERGDRRRFTLVCLSVVAGGLLFLPWLPSFLVQVQTTGTPWGLPARPASVLAISFIDYGGGSFGEAQLLGATLAILVALAVFGRTLDNHRIELDLRTRSEARPELFVVGATLLFSVVGNYATDGAFVSRYTSVIFPLVILLASLGLTRFANPFGRGLLLASLAITGILGSVDNALTNRTQAPQFAEIINAEAGPDDVVAFCPDQLGPATSRLLLPQQRELAVTFPDFGRPRRVNWQEYAERNLAKDPSAFARELDQRAGDNGIWLVWSDQYRPIWERCEDVRAELEELRPEGRPRVESGKRFEHGWMDEFPAVER